MAVEGIAAASSLGALNTSQSQRPGQSSLKSLAKQAGGTGKNTAQNTGESNQTSANNGNLAERVDTAKSSREIAQELANDAAIISNQTFRGAGEVARERARDVSLIKDINSARGSGKFSRQLRDDANSANDESGGNRGNIIDTVV